MLDLYAWPTPNAYKVSIMLEEIGLPYNVIPVDIRNGEQSAPDFVKLSPNGKMPAIVDHDVAGGPVSIFESGAILMYLAEKSGRFWPTQVYERYDTAQWVMWQMAGLGPMSGQAFHFSYYAPDKLPYAINRYMSEVRRLFGVLDHRLADRDWIAGDYSIADMACYSWSMIFEHLAIDIYDYPAVQRWQDKMGERPAVQRGVALLKEFAGKPEKLDRKARQALFGKQED
ncbi:MAG: putative glutathione transferase [Sphingomonadales bacterium]|jgi:GST-like protein|nr:putative glutathione transferase [Sphingomonadales bacterium]